MDAVAEECTRREIDGFELIVYRLILTKWTNTYILYGVISNPRMAVSELFLLPQE